MQITTEKAIKRTHISSNIDQIETYLENKIRGETSRLGGSKTRTQGLVLGGTEQKRLKILYESEGIFYFVHDKTYLSGIMVVPQLFIQLLLQLGTWRVVSSRDMNLYRSIAFSPPVTARHVANLRKNWCK